MAGSNPAFSRVPEFGGRGRAQAPADLSADQLSDLYNRPAASGGDMGRMTIEDTLAKTGIAFAILVVAAAVTFMIPALAVPGMIVGGLVGFVLAMVNIFKKEPSAPLILAYAAFEGLFVGGISAIFESRWDGIVVQAVLATLVVVGTTLALFANGKIRASKKATKIFLIAMIGYGVFSLVNFGLTAFGVLDGFGMRSGPIGIVIGLFAVVLAAYSLVLDFDSIQKGVRAGAPAKYGWTGAFGIMVTVVWLYTEILRIIAIFRE